MLQGREVVHLDILVALDDVISRLNKTSGLLVFALQELDMLLAQDDEAIGLVLGEEPLPEAPSWRALWEYVRQRVHDVLEGTVVLPVLTGQDHPERWRRPDRGTALEVTAVRHVYARELERVRTGPAADWDGLTRRQLYVPDPRPGAPDGAVVVVARPAGDLLGIVEAYALGPLDLGLREAWPAVTQHLGAHQTRHHGDWPTLNSQDAALETTEPARTQVRDELARLLTEDDATITAVIAATGSYATPSGPVARHWIDRQLWRLDAWTWTDEEKP